MRTVAEIIADLQAYPPDAKCAAYEREESGLVVYDAEGNTLGVVAAPFIVEEKGRD